jgi:hypothetical protein
MIQSKHGRRPSLGRDDLSKDLIVFRPWPRAGLLQYQDAHVWESGLKIFARVKSCFLSLWELSR